MHRLLVQRVKQAARLLVEAAAELVHLRVQGGEQGEQQQTGEGSARGQEA